MMKAISLYLYIFAVVSDVTSICNKCLGWIYVSIAYIPVSLFESVSKQRVRTIEQKNFLRLKTALTRSTIKITFYFVLSKISS